MEIARGNGNVHSRTSYAMMMMMMTKCSTCYSYEWWRIITVRQIRVHAVSSYENSRTTSGVLEKVGKTARMSQDGGAAVVFRPIL